MNLKDYIAANRRRTVKLGEAEITVFLASLEQLERFAAETKAVESAQEAQLAFALRWLKELVPEFDGSEDIPPALAMELFNAIIPVAFTPRKNA